MKKPVKKFFSLLGLFMCFDASYAAQAVNVEYIHNLIRQKWDIDISYANVSQKHNIANMKYLLTAIDVANEKLNGDKTTDYGNGEFATLQAVDTIATNTAIETLIQASAIEEPSTGGYLVLRTTKTDYFYVGIYAGGTFTIDWGDGTTETIEQEAIDFWSTYPIWHDYDDYAEYTITISGLATEYISLTDSDDIRMNITNTLSFLDPDSWEGAPVLETIEGDVGKMFPVAPDGTKPTFSSMFEACYSLTNIHADLFKSAKAPTTGMFISTFQSTNLNSVPETLFHNIRNSADSMFKSTFNLSNLPEIPANLFITIKNPANDLFYGTFANNIKLKTIPDNLFSGLTDFAPGIFCGTFNNVSKLQSIPENLFNPALKNATPQDKSLDRTFYICRNLTGDSAKIDGEYLYDIWPNATTAQVSRMYQGATGLSDYANIPAAWK